MNEPKKRGRPSKAEVVAREAKAKFAAFTSGSPDGVKPFDPSEPVQVYVDQFTVLLAQAYALRIWRGFSPQVPRHERIAFCAQALKDQNLPTEGVEYPE